jgi:choline dehydrogenase
MRQALKAVRQIGNTSPLKDILGAELTPGPTVVTDSDWEAWIRNNAATEFHPTATCAMLPEAQGGVVDANLKVYGTCTPPPPQTSCSFSCSFYRSKRSSR